MAFEDFETGDGSPVELLTFRNGQDLIWRYTNANGPLVIGALAYEPLAYKRTEPTNSKNTDDARLRITLPGNTPVVGLYTTILTSNITTVTIERFHNDDPTKQAVVYWKGQVGSATRADEQAEILAIPFQEAPHEIPNHTYQALCNVFLYEGICGLGISRDDFKFDGAVSSITQFGSIIKIPGLRAQAAAIDAGVSGALNLSELDIYWQAGYVRTSTEFRPIMQAAAGGDPDSIRVLQPFRELAVGQAVTVFAGCDHSIDTCNRKFANALNFQGHPYGPQVNPFRTELPPGSRNPADPSDFFFPGFGIGVP